MNDDHRSKYGLQYEDMLVDFPDRFITVPEFLTKITYRHIDDTPLTQYEIDDFELMVQSYLVLDKRPWLLGKSLAIHPMTGAVGCRYYTRDLVQYLVSRNDGSYESPS